MNRTTLGNAGSYDPATQPKQPDKSLGELFGDLTTDLGELFRKEVELAKVEAREEASRAGRAAGMAGGAAIGGLLALTFLSAALAWLLDQGINRALAFAIVGAVWAIVAIVLLARAKREIKAIRPIPTTVETLKEDVQWGASTEELKQDIEATRSDLTETLDAIGDRVSPSRVMERRKNLMAQSVGSLRDRVMGSAHDVADSAKDMPDMVRSRTEGAPILAGALAFGVGFLVAALVPPTEMEREAGGTILEKAQPVKDQLLEAGREVGQHLSEPAKESVQAVKDKAGEAAQTLSEHAKEARDDVTEQAGAAVENVRSQS